MKDGKKAQGTKGPESQGMRLRMGPECELRVRVHCAFSGEDYGEFAAAVLLPWLRRWGKGRESIPTSEPSRPLDQAPEPPAEAASAA